MINGRKKDEGAVRHGHSQRGVESIRIHKNESRGHAHWNHRKTIWRGARRLEKNAEQPGLVVGHVHQPPALGNRLCAGPVKHYPDFVQTCGLGSVTGIGGANCRHSYWPFIEGVSQRTYTDEELEEIDPPPFLFEGKTYTQYEATQKQRQIERTIRRLKRERAAYRAAGLKEEETAASARIRRLDEEYRAFSKAADLPQQRERMNVAYPWKLTDIKKFAALNEYDGKIQIVDKFSENEYVVEMEPPVISGVRQHVVENERYRADRKGLNFSFAQSIITNKRLSLYQSNRGTIKFLADQGYAVINTKKEVITIVPEKLRKKYRDYLGGKVNGKKSN